MLLHNILSCFSTNMVQSPLGKQQQGAERIRAGNWVALMTADTAEPAQPLATFALLVSILFLESKYK